MKVLFAIEDENNIIDSLTRKYKIDFDKKMSYTEAKNFTAIIKEIQQNNNYDRIVISENFDSKINNSDKKEAILLKRIKGLLSIAKGKRGKNIPIIFLGKNDGLVKYLMDLNIYNFLIGKDVTKKNIYELIINPRNISKAKEYYKSISKLNQNEVIKNKKMDITKRLENKMEVKNNVSIVDKYIAYLNKPNLSEEKYVSKFESACEKLDSESINTIISSIKESTKKILKKNSKKYNKLVEKNNKKEPEKQLENKKRGRGRPRKVVTEEVVVKEKKKRGRPRKNPTVVDEVVEEKVAKKSTETDKKKSTEAKAKKSNKNTTKEEKKVSNKDRKNKPLNDSNNPKVISEFDIDDEMQNKKNFEYDDWDLEDDDILLDEDFDLEDNLDKKDHDLNLKDNDRDLDLDDDEEDLDLDEDEEDLDLDEDEEDLDLDEDEDEEDLDLDEDEEDLDLDKDEEDLDLDEDEEDLDLDEDEEDLDLDEDEEDLDLDEDEEDLDLDEDEEDLDLDEDEEDLDLDEDEEDLDLDKDEEDLDLDEDEEDLDLDEDEEDLDLDEDEEDLDLDEDEEDLDLDEDEEDLDLDEDEEDLDLDEDEEDLDLDEDEEDLDLDEDEEDLDLDEEEEDLDLDEDEEDLDLDEDEEDSEDNDIMNLDDEEDSEDDDIMDLDDEEDSEADDIMDLDDEKDSEEENIMDLDDEEDSEADDIMDLDDEEDSEDDDIMDLDDEEDSEADDIMDLDDEEDLEDNVINLDDDSLKIKDKELSSNNETNNSTSGIKNKNYIPNFDISKQLKEINNEESSNKSEFNDVKINNNKSLEGKIKIGENQKIVSFVGSRNSGNSFLINNIAHMLSEQGVKTAIVDLTKNKNSYYIYTENEENLRSIAYSCFEKLKSGIADGIKVNKNLTVYTSLPNSDEEIEHKEMAMSTLLNNYSLILLDCDFDTNLEYFNICQEIYFVQSLDILTIQTLTGFIKKLKMNKIGYEDKMKIVINKYVNVSSINEKAIVAAISVYNSPDTTYQLDLFDRNKVEYFLIPFEEKNYCKYLDEIIRCKLSIRGYSKSLINSLNKLVKSVYPINGKKYKSK